MSKLKKIEEVAKEGDNSFDPAKAKPFVDQLLKIAKEADDVRMRALAMYNQADDAGVPRKELKAVVKIMKKKLDADHKDRVNRILVAIGESPLFAVPVAA